MTRVLTIIYTCLLILCSCSEQSEEIQSSETLQAVQEEPARKGKQTTPDTTTFEAAFEQFYNALQASDTAALNAFIGPQQGFWLIEQPGALPTYTHFSNMQAVKREYQERPFTSINQEIRNCQLQLRQSLPNFDCATMGGNATGFAEDGCFYSTNTSAFRTTDMWKYASLSQAHAQQVQQLQKQVAITVLHTATAYRFHFGYRNGSWFLLFADLRIPCSA